MRVIYGENARVLEWVAAQSEYRWAHLESTIALEREGQIIAAAGYTDYVRGGSISGHIIARDAHAMNRAFVHAILWYPFEQLQVRRLSGLIPSKNTKVARFMEHIGFTLEARMQAVFPDDDLLVYRFLREEYLNG